jgi:hypothetical protein
MKRLTPLLIALSLLALPATGFAQGSFDGEQDETEESSEQIGITGTVHIGPSLFFGRATGFGANAQAGFHLDIYPGYEISENLSVEMNLGFRNNPQLPGGRISLIPVLVPGARYHFDLGSEVKPYVHGHLGLGFRRSTSVGFFGASASQARASFTLNYGGGVNYWINEYVGVGGGLTMRHHTSQNGLASSFDVNLGTSFKF